MQKTYQVLLYYHYVKVDDPEALQRAHYAFCLTHQLLGRIIISKEGLNGTVSGLAKDCHAYMAWVKQDPRFAAIDFKVDPHHQHAFQKLNIRVKPEIVNSGLPDLDPNQYSAKKLDADRFQKMIHEEDVVLLDVRSLVECETGRFEGSTYLPINTFREFPEAVQGFIQARKADGKRVVTICTGNIKCEKASAFLLDSGLKEVYQLDGGIIKYSKTSDGRYFEGSCYVFDNRLSVPVNQVNPTIINRCHHCKTPCERLVNCAYVDCNHHVALCQACATALEGTCSEQCAQQERKRPYDGTGYYTTDLNGYQPQQALRHLDN